MMNFNEFTKAIEITLKEKLPTHDIALTSTTKNNGLEKIGITIKTKGSNIAPCVYMEDYFTQYENNSTIDEVSNLIINTFHTIPFPIINVEELTNLATIESKIFCKLINYRSNETLLQTTPHVPFQDLAIVFYVLMEMDANHGTSTMLIKTDNIRMWNISTDDLYAIALKNSLYQQSAILQSMESVIFEVIDNSSDTNIVNLLEEDDVKKDRMYVVSNQYRNFGASTITYPKQLDKIGTKLNESFYILPSSIHECILVPLSLAPDKSDLEEMVREINASQVAPDEVLSNTVYFYDIDTHTLS